MPHIPAHAVTAAGTPPPFGAAASDDTAPTGARTFLVVRNGGGSAITVTLTPDRLLETGVPYPAREYEVADGEEAWIPLLALYRGADGVAELDWSTETDVTRAVVSI
jgi:hypothetical protein